MEENVFKIYFPVSFTMINDVFMICLVGFACAMLDHTVTILVRKQLPIGASLGLAVHAVMIIPV